MLKFKKKKYKSCFTKKNGTLKLFYPKNEVIFSKNKSQFQIKCIVNTLKRLKKKFKKRKLYLYIFLYNNFIKTYKSKNSRMGKGKGSLRKFSIRHESRMIGITKMSPICRSLFLKKIIYLYKA